MKGGNMEWKMIEGYLDAEGRITQMPSKKKKKLYVCLILQSYPGRTGIYRTRV